VELQLLSFLTSAVNVHLQVPATLLARKASLVHTEYENGWVPAPVWAHWRRNKLLLPTRIKPRSSDLRPVAQLLSTSCRLQRLQSPWHRTAHRRQTSELWHFTRSPVSMVTRLRAGRLENRGSIPDRKDDLPRFYSRGPCRGSG
jgi:hypothetical protein